MLDYLYMTEKQPEDILNQDVDGERVEVKQPPPLQSKEKVVDSEKATILVSPDSLVPGLDTDGLDRQRGREDVRVWYGRKLEGTDAAQDLADKRVAAIPEVGSNSPTRTIPYANELYQPDSERLREVFSSFKNQIVVDLGAGSYPYGYYIADSAEAKGYIGVEPNFPYYLAGSLVRNTEIQYEDLPQSIDVEPRHLLNKTPAVVVNEDMLSFLKRLPDNSVSIFCSGIDYYIIPEQNYRDEVAKEIVRVLNPNGVYIGEQQVGHITLKKAEGIDETVIDNISDKYLRRQSVRVYRKMK